MGNSNLTVDVLRPLVMVFHFIAIVPTIFRLIYRYRIDRLGWDDLWAFYAMLWTLLLLAIYAITSTTTRDFGTDYLNFVYIGSILSVLHAVWGARLSVAVTIVRLLATGTTRIVAKVASCLVAVFALASMIQTLLVCGPPLTSKFLCTDPNVPGYFLLTITLIADIWLIALPAYLLANMNLSKRHHRLLQAIFACEILVTGISVAHCVFVIKKNLLGQAFSAHFEVSISLIVCNLLFLVTYIYRVAQNSEEEPPESESKTETSPRRPLTGTAGLSLLTSSALTSSFISTSWTTIADASVEADEGARAIKSEPAAGEAFQKVIRENVFANHSVG